MKKILLFSFSFFLLKNIIAQKAYFQQEVNYTINAKLDDRRHKLTADISIEYTNNSPDPLSILYFHLWANAFDSKKSAFAKQELRNGKTDFYFANDKQQGGYSDLDFKIDGKKCEVEIDSKSPDIAKLTLATPLASGQKITISTPFTLKIPYAFSRIGHIGQQYLMTQWYPKPAVYDAQGWHAMPYLDQGEFYAEFGNYDVSLTLPENYVIGATGVLQTESEKDFLAQKAKNTEGVLAQKKDIKSENDTFPKSSETLKTIRYKAEKVHDFAWFTDKRFLVQKSEVALKSGKKVDTYTFFTPKNSVLWSKSSEYINRSVQFYSEQVGEYPHPQASAVMSDAPFGGGMEYPMITVISGEYDAKSLDIVIAHEVGHNWFQGILASNERDHAWMDEGLNSFYEHRYDNKFYPKKANNTVDVGNPDAVGKGDDSWFFKGSGYDLNTFANDYLIKGGQNQPATLTSDSLTTYNFFIGSYIKPSMALEKIEKMMGTEKFDAVMKSYYQDWQFKHPQPDDFYAYWKNIDKAETTFKNTLQGELAQKREGSKPVQFKFGFGVDNPNKSNLYWSPVIAANKYDGVMFGLALHNGNLPAKNFEWAIAPLYGFNSKTLTGVCDINYHILGKNNKITLGLGAKRFSFENNEKFNVSQSYSKITPSVSIEFGDKPLSKFTHKLSFRHLILNEDELSFDTSGVYKGKESASSNINELSYSGLLKNALGNTSFRLAVEQQGYKNGNNDENYLKTTLEVKRSFAYRNKKSIYVRLFAGSFLSNTGKTSGSFFGARSRGSLGLVGRGLNDYRYDDFYLGRNESERLISQQINPNTEGGMKIILPQGSETVIGFSNSLVGALNLKFDMPVDLPFGLNIRPYLDLGYFDDTRPEGIRSTNTLLASGGLSLEIGDYFGIYMPLYFSGSEDDPNSLKSLVKQRGDFVSRISFNLNLKALNPLTFIKKMVDSF